MATHSACVTRGQAFERDMDYLPDRITARPGRSRDRHEPQPLEPPTWPAFGDNTDVGQIKQHYYGVQTDVNPSQIVPQGPDESGWRTPHGRERL